MLDKVILRLKEEVAMDGAQGTSINDMWCYIQRFLSHESNKLNNSDTDAKTLEPTMDSQYKSFFWHYFRHIPELSFFIEKEDAHTEMEDNSADDSSYKGEDKEEDMGTEIEHDLIDGITELEYDQVESQYGSLLRVVADKKLQEAQLFVGIPIGQSWSVYLRNYLTTILQAREAGITQCELTKKWKTDPRSSGHFAKSLEAKGAIQRIMVTYKGMRTNLCIHARFKNRDQAPGNSDNSKSHNANMLGTIFTKQIFRDRLIALLNDAKDNVMFSTDILSAMGFDLNNTKTRQWFNRSIDRLVHEGLIRKLTAQRNNAGVPQRCLQLLEHSSNSFAAQKYDDDDDDGGNGTEDTTSTYDDLAPFVMTSKSGLNNTSKLLHTMSLDKQILQVVQDAGDQGITNKDIAIAVRCDNIRMIQRSLDRLGEIQGDGRFKYGFERALEFEGRNRRYRFYAYDTYLKMNESGPVEVPVVNPFIVKESDLKDVDYQAMKSGKAKKTAATKKADSRSKATTDQDYSPAQHPEAVIPSMFLRNRQSTLAATDAPDSEQSTTDLNTSTSETPTEQVPAAPKRRGRPRKNPTKPVETSDNNVSTLQQNFGSEQSTTDLNSSTSETTTEQVPAAPKRRGRPRKNLPNPVETSDNNVATLQQNPTATPPPPIYETNVITMNPPIDNTVQQPNTGIDSLVPSTGVSVSDAQPSGVQSPDAQPSDSIGSSSSTTLQQDERGKAPAIESTATVETRPSATKRSQPDSEGTSAPSKRPTRSANTITGYFKTINRKKNVNVDSNSTTSAQALASSHPSESPHLTESVVSIPTPLETAAASSSASISAEKAAEAPTETPTTSTASAEAVAITSPPTESLTTVSPGSTEISPSSVSESTSATPIAKRTAQQKPTAKSKMSHKHKSVQINKYFEERKQVLLAILDDIPVIERGVLLRDRFLEKRTELFGNTGNNSHEMDMKTLWRSAVALKNEGRIHIQEGNISLLNGNKKKKQVMVHKSLDPDGPEVAEYFDRLNELKILQPGAIKLEPIEKTRVAVESLEDRLTRMQESREQAVAAGKLAEAKRLDSEIQLITGNKILSSETSDLLKPRKVGNWLLIGMKFGYINSFMVRVKMLHQYLLTMLLTDSGADDGVDLEKRLIPITAMVHRMPLSLFCTIIGVFTPTDEFSEYMEDESRAAVSLGDLPDNIRGCAFNQKNRSIFRLRMLIRCLVYLGVLENGECSTTGDKSENNDDKGVARAPPQLKLAYKLTTKATIKNYRLPGHPVIQEHPLLNLAELMLYWSELQYVCTKSNLGDDESATLCVDNMEPGDEECVRTLYTLRNWGHSMIFTRKQKDVMNEYVDKENSTTPYVSPAWCRSIALEVGATMEGVRSYYRKVEVAMGKLARVQKLKREINHEDISTPASRSSRRQAELVPGRQRRRRRRQIDDGIVSEDSRVITRTTTSPFKFKRTCIPYTERLAKEQQNQQLHVDEQGRPVGAGNFLDDNATIPYLTQDDIESKLIKTRSKRSVWSVEEDDLLKLSYVIMNHRRENGCRFLWKPIGHLLSRFTIPQCSRRLGIIRENPKHAEDLQNIRIRWHRYYYQGVQDKDLAVWKTVNDNDFDITSYLAYYLRQCQSDQEQDAPIYHTHLPANTRIIDQNFEINAITALNQQSDGFFEDSFHEKSTGIGMRQALFLQGFTQRINLKESYDNMPTQHMPDLEVNKRIIELLKHLFKMILMTPAEVYDPYYANSILSSYPEQLLKTAFVESRRAGVLIQAKGDRIGDRRIPKTILGISERFMRSMTPLLPENIMMQASEYERYLMQTIRTSLNPVELNSGMMLCIFDLFSVGKLSIDMEDVGGFIEKFRVPRHASRQINENKQNYGISFTITEPRPTSIPLEQTTKELVALTAGQSDQTSKQLGDLLDNQMTTLVQNTVAYLHSRGNLGATVLELKQKLLGDDHVGNLSDDLLMSVVEAITLKAHPPLAAFVGYFTPRLVLTTELATWAILPKTIPATYLDSAYKRRRLLNAAPKSTQSVQYNSTTEQTPSQETIQVNSGNTTPISTTVTSPLDDDDLLVAVKQEDIQPTPTMKSIADNDTTLTWAPKRHRPDDFGTVSGERQQELARERQDVVMPRMWMDINGHVTESIWRGCVKLLVEMIMRRPGITYGHLCRTMNATLSPMEIKDLLNDLLQRGVLRQLSVSTGKAPSPLAPNSGLFNSKHITRTVPCNTIDPAIQTSYWLLPGHYSKLAV